MSATTTTETAEVRDILDRAMKLSETDRAIIGRVLLNSVYPPPNSDADWEYWKAEIKRRIEAVESGEMKALMHEEAMAKIRKARKERES